ncbi:hypothetical protein CEXT_445091 [Caerostris extrusa]|uniref:Uncharacterized protein n=1 Tax=Caerostris extrusa TaxID=172846 RepID=A0AAV4XEA6_CAEEX|nr:hypothetical protein CEXT_445091 [Caerostris extrusa]
MLKSPQEPNDLKRSKIIHLNPPRTVVFSSVSDMDEKLFNRVLLFPSCCYCSVYYLSRGFGSRYVELQCSSINLKEKSSKNPQKLLQVGVCIDYRQNYCAVWQDSLQSGERWICCIFVVSVAFEKNIYLYDLNKNS